MSDSLWPHGILQARILEWVAFPFSRGSSQPRDQTQVSYIAGRFFTNWALREAQESIICWVIGLQRWKKHCLCSWGGICLVVQLLSPVWFLCNPMDCTMPGSSVLQYLLESAQTHVHWISDAIQPSHPLSSPSPALNLSQNQDLFKWISSLHQVAKILEFQLQHQSFQWTPRTDIL